MSEVKRYWLADDGTIRSEPPPVLGSGWIPAIDFDRANERIQSLEIILEQIRREVGSDSGNRWCRNVLMILQAVKGNPSPSIAQPTWTEARPTVAGWYWWRRPGAPSPTIIYFGNGFRGRHGEFAGPLQPPWEEG